MYLTVSTTDQVQAWCNFSPRDNTVVDNGTSGDSEKDELAAYIEAIAVNKDREAFKRLFGLMAPQIKAYCIKRGSNPAAAEEMAQETMIQVWRRAGQFDARRASVKTWIYTIARNKRIDHFRKEQRPELTAEDLAQGISPSLDAQDHMELAEAGETLAEKIRDLSAEQAEVIHKAFFEDKTHQVIAEELNLPLGTVKSRIRLALNKLRSSMAEHEE
ncbi:MAG: sigma-70 family RNA polymerase sigma factor [Alphaproteobacteria bacterium]